MYIKPFHFAALALAFVGCSTPHIKLLPGEFEMTFFVKDVEIPIALEISDSIWYIHNAQETIPLHPNWPEKDSFFIDIPVFHTVLSGRLLTDQTFSGTWTDPTRIQNNQVPFTAKFKSPAFKKTIPAETESIWDCTFSPESNKDRSRAVGIFKASTGQLTGTFLTETGDYRYLSGQSTGQSLHLSCFDGTHLFYFCANINGDSLTDGRFISGNTWEEPWQGYNNPQAKLADPDSLTAWVGNDKIKFSAYNTRSQRVEFDSTDFKDKVTIIQIFGTWCPNCSDESKFLQELHDIYAPQHLQIIPVAFEREATLEQQIQRIMRQFKDLEISYEPYLGGKSSKSHAHEVFPQLNHIISYPTTIIIDKKSQVRKIHTGFYGPGTGKYYDHHKELLHMFIAQLIQEP